jgi:SulP family sulfate permease
MPLVMYTIFGSCTQLAVGANSLIALLVGEAITGIVAVGSDRYIPLAVSMSFSVGVLLVLGSWFNLGWVSSSLQHQFQFQFQFQFQYRFQFQLQYEHQHQCQ